MNEFIDAILCKLHKYNKIDVKTWIIYLGLELCDENGKYMQITIANFTIFADINIKNFDVSKQNSIFAKYNFKT